jgi:hypothetical protein
MKGFAKNTTSPNSVQQGWLAVKVKPELQRLLLENGCFRQDGLSHSLLPTLQLHGLVSLCVQNANGVLLCELPRWLLGCDGLGPEHGDYGGLNVLHTLQEDGHRWRCGPKREGLLPLECACTSVNMCVCARAYVCARLQRQGPSSHLGAGLLSMHIHASACGCKSGSHLLPIGSRAGGD